ncbi:MAG: DNA polymerase III subunit gamma/tau [Alphaproteobacteria bacterium]
MTDIKNYIVLARKYRPKKLSDIVGQDEACKIIEGSIKLDRLAHAFIFSGTRGVGKTTLARILSKIVNCLNLRKELIEPCGNCDNCRSIDKGNNIDVVEIDAASRTGVSDVREIIDNVNYKPVAAKKKIFIIDEIHMLSKAAFNALLKTLEEPPADVLFIFATTETEKIPLTILSRCQRFQLKRVDTRVISDFLMNISVKEGYEIEKLGCDLISQGSEGSIRDALSILDNVLARGTPVKIETIRNVLGLSDNTMVIRLLNLLFEGDVNESIKIFNDLYLKGISIFMLSQTLMKFVYYAMRIKIGFNDEDITIEPNILSNIKDISKKYDIDFMTRFWELIQKYANELNECFDERQSFEVTIMRLCYVSLIPTPFELLEGKIKLSEVEPKKPKIPEEHKLDQKECDEIPSAQLSNSDKNLAVNMRPYEDTQIDKIPVKQEPIIDKFKFLVEEIEKSSEILISYHLKNSFRLVNFIDTENLKEIQLESISENSDAKKILWKASKLLNNITNDRWMISLSSNKGVKSIAEYDQEIEQQKLLEVESNSYVKKILEIIPSSRVVSIKKLSESLKRKEDHE